MPARLLALLLLLAAPALGQISADPNPAPLAPGQELGTTTLRWEGLGSFAIRVTVEVDGDGVRHVFAGHGPGEASAGWIQAGHAYLFRVEAEVSPGSWAELGAVQVTAQAAPPPPPVGLADVVVTAIELTPSEVAAGRPLAIRARVENRGGAATGDLVGVGFLVDGAPIGWGVVSPLGPGQSASVDLVQGYQAPAVGWHTVTAVADDVDRFPEADEGNNRLERGFESRRVPVRFERRGTQVLRDGVPFRLVGMNTFDLGTQAQGVGSGAGLDLGRALMGKAIRDAADFGAPLLRFSTWGFGANDLAIWRDQRELFLSRLDAVFERAEAEGVLLVPVLCWRPISFCELTGEPLSTMVRDPNSQAYQLLRELVASLVVRYRDRDSVLLWELTNEMNLEADLDPSRRGGRREDAYTSDEMAAFVRRFAQEVRFHDPVRPISSGYADPRPAAWHLRARPEWVNGGDWREDSFQELQAYFQLTHPDPVDVLSVHFYNFGPGSNERLGHRGKDNPGALGDYARAARNLGKPLFVGEFGDVHPFLREAPHAPFARACLAEMERHGIALGAAWNLSFFQFSPTEVDAFSFLPGVHDGALFAFRDWNGRAGSLPPARQRAPGLAVVPPAGARVGAAIDVAVHASDADGLVEVRLYDPADPTAWWIPGVRPVGSPVHLVSWTPAVPGPRELIVEAVDAAGQVTQVRLAVEVSP